MSKQALQHKIVFKILIVVNIHNVHTHIIKKEQQKIKKNKK